MRQMARQRDRIFLRSTDHFGVAVLVTGMGFAGYASYLSLIYPY